MRPTTGLFPAFLAALLLCQAAPSLAGASKGDVEPRLRIDMPPGGGVREVALTFDACSGPADQRILSVLVDNAIPATIFVTHRWLRRNAEALAVLLAHPDLFEIENHGDRHVPAVTGHATVFGLETAGTIAAVQAEVEGGASAILAATGASPKWFRGATARYSRDAMAEIVREGYRVAGYSLNADIGASLAAAAVEKRIASARSGDVVIAHINQPNRPSGAGIAAGILDLKAAGVRFVRLSDVSTTDKE